MQRARDLDPARGGSPLASPSAPKAAAARPASARTVGPGGSRLAAAAAKPSSGGDDAAAAATAAKSGSSSDDESYLPGGSSSSSGGSGSENYASDASISGSESDSGGVDGSSSGREGGSLDSSDGGAAATSASPPVDAPPWPPLNGDSFAAEGVAATSPAAATAQQNGGVGHKGAASQAQLAEPRVASGAAAAALLTGDGARGGGQIGVSAQRWQDAGDASAADELLRWAVASAQHLAPGCSCCRSPCALPCFRGRIVTVARSCEINACFHL